MPPLPSEVLLVASYGTMKGLLHLASVNFDVFQVLSEGKLEPHNALPYVLHTYALRFGLLLHVHFEHWGELLEIYASTELGVSRNNIHWKCRTC